MFWLRHLINSARTVSASDLTTTGAAATAATNGRDSDSDYEEGESDSEPSEDDRAATRMTDLVHTGDLSRAMYFQQQIVAALQAAPGQMRKRSELHALLVRTRTPRRV